MIKQTILLSTLAITIGASSLSANNEKTVFDSGIRSALKVLKYEKENSMTQTDSDIKNKFCVSLYRTDKQVIKPFDVVKMESLALYLEYKPSYLQFSEDGESKNVFCFAGGDTAPEAEANLKAIRARYPKIDDYNPMVIQLTSKGQYKRAIPFLGIWAKDMSETVSALNSKIESQKIELAKAKKESELVSKKLAQIKEQITSLTSGVINASESKIASESQSGTPDYKTIEAEALKESEAIRKKYAEDAKKSKQAKKSKDKSETVLQSPDSPRVYTVKKK